MFKFLLNSLRKKLVKTPMSKKTVLFRNYLYLLDRVSNLSKEELDIIKQLKKEFKVLKKLNI